MKHHVNVNVDYLIHTNWSFERALNPKLDHFNIFESAIIY